jgi:hypothetical protein
MPSTPVMFVYKHKHVTLRVDYFSRTSDVLTFISVAFGCGRNVLLFDPNNQNDPIEFDSASPLPIYAVKKFKCTL